MISSLTVFLKAFVNSATNNHRAVSEFEIADGVFIGVLATEDLPHQSMMAGYT